LTSAAVNTESRCSSMARLLGAHADGQLDTARTLEVDDHLAQCETCRERVALDRALRGSLKKAVRTSAPSDVRARVLASLASAAARADGSDANANANAETSADASLMSDGPLDPPSSTPSSRGRISMLRHWRTMLPVASAAAVALAWGVAGKQPMAATDASVAARAGFGNDELVNQFVEVHSRPLRPETPDPKMVRGFEREVGVPVHVPQFENAQFRGGRLLPVAGGERVAMVQYDVQMGSDTRDLHRVTLFIYDPRKIQLGTGPQLPPRAVGTAQVRVGQARGYSVAIAQHGEVGYAVASDLDAESNAALVAKADQDQP
jgi:anti-sigma factor RsiW